MVSLLKNEMCEFNMILMIYGCISKEYIEGNYKVSYS